MKGLDRMLTKGSVKWGLLEELEKRIQMIQDVGEQSAAERAYDGCLENIAAILRLLILDTQRLFFLFGLVAGALFALLLR
ncbi:MAG: hypothetical protein IKP72_15375 [Clostridia bacterium]|nr:hypothetical protein [Clostridia bacterium]